MGFGRFALTAAALGAMASPAAADYSWAYHFRTANSQTVCMSTADTVVRTYQRFNDVTFVRDYETDAVMELNFTYVTNASADITALFICSAQQTTIVVFGEPYEAALTVRDDLRELFASFE